MNHFSKTLLMAVLFVTGLAAQVTLGVDAYSTTEMVDASEAPTNNEASLKGSGTDILIGNGFGVNVIIEIRSANGDLLFSTTVLANDFALGTHTIPPGTHTVKACDASNPPPQTCGTVCVS